MCHDASLPFLKDEGPTMSRSLINDLVNADSDPLDKRILCLNHPSVICLEIKVPLQIVETLLKPFTPASHRSCCPVSSFPGDSTRTVGTSFHPKILSPGHLGIFPMWCSVAGLTLGNWVLKTFQRHQPLCVTTQSHLQPEAWTQQSAHPTAV